MDEVIQILCVDDEPSVLKSLKRIFLDENYIILTASSGQDGINILEKESVQIVISDYRMPKMNGVEFLRKVYARWPDTVRIALSGYADASAIVAAINEGHIYKFIPKPWNDDDLLVTVKNAIERHSLYGLNRKLSADLMLKNEELSQVNQQLNNLLDEKSRSLDFTSKSLASYQSLLNAVPVGILGIDLSNLIVMCNDSCRSVCEKEAGLVGSNAEVVASEDVRRFISRVKEAGRMTEDMIHKGKRLKMIGSTIDKKGIIIVFVPEDDEQ